MQAPPHPDAEDVIIRREPTGTFSIGVSSRTPQILCGSFLEALQRADSFATRQHVHVWYTAEGRIFALVADVKLLRRVWNEYVEMPGLRLSCKQGQRLWSVDADTCTSVLNNLVDLKFLVRGTDGNYARLAEAREALPRRRRSVKAGMNVRETARTLRPVG